MKRAGSCAVAILLAACVCGCGPRGSSRATTTPAGGTSGAGANPAGLGGGTVVLADGATRDVATSLLACFRAANQHAWDAAAACYREDAVIEAPGTGSAPLSGRGNIVSGRMQAPLAVFSDLTSEPQLTLIDAARAHAVVVLLSRGTHDGAMGKMPASRRRIALFTAIALDLDDSGHIAAGRSYTDRGTILSQLGLGSAQHRPASAEALPISITAGGSDVAKDAEKTGAIRALVSLLAGRDPLAASMLYGEDAIVRDVTLPADLIGRQALVQHFTALVGAFSNLAITIDAAFAAGEWVAVESTLTGINDGPLPWFGSKKKTGKPATVRRLEVVRMAGDRIAEHWLFYDAYAIAIELGLATPPAGPAADQPGAEPDAAR